ncbi:sugar ABC transporter substrate-binding protein [Lachnospiraceae bacterium OttesenSCG-928-D06]|nr:sugar ABC transporter substrate-binding protein [Lachnospiraceae bacterium OttesenSCG-928-D06]
MKKKICVLLSLAMVASLAACGSDAKETKTDAGQSSTSTTESKTEENAGAATEDEGNLGYTYGETFYSDEPVSYTMFWSDHEAYPLADTWEIFDKIAEITNVTLDIDDYMIARTDYDEKKALMINGGQAAYIIPKTYDESAFVDGGAVVAVSDWAEYMPNYNSFIEAYEMEADIDTIRKADGKYYRFPGLNEVALQEYTFMIRKDIFDAAGVDVAALEKTWTWNDLYDALVTVKDYMVSEGMCKESDYIWSERWPGDDGSGGNLLKLMGSSYGVPSGWAVKDGMAYDHEKEEWYFASTSEDYKEYITMLNKFIKGGLLDPESFTQTDEQGCQKFYRGETVMIATNKSTYTDYMSNLESTLGADNFELYIAVYPMGSKGYTAENQRLENGVMISSKALTELGEEEFIKLIRFVDWLFYSDEAYDLTKWGVEGQTYEMVKDETTGREIKQLLPQWYCGGLAIGQTSDDQEDMRIKLGYAGGVLYYAGTAEQVADAFNPVLQDYFARVKDYRDLKPLDPAVAGSEDENEQINLWKTPLISNVNSWTLQFAIGQKDIEADWDAYVSSCENLMSKQLVDLYNEINQK